MQGILLARFYRYDKNLSLAYLETAPEENPYSLPPVACNFHRRMRHNAFAVSSIHQCIPAQQNFIVKRGPYPLLPMFQQFLPSLCESICQIRSR